VKTLFGPSAAGEASLVFFLSQVPHFLVAATPIVAARSPFASLPNFQRGAGVGRCREAFAN